MFNVLKLLMIDLHFLQMCTVIDYFFSTIHFQSCNIGSFQLLPYEDVEYTQEIIQSHYKVMQK